MAPGARSGSGANAFLCSITRIDLAVAACDGFAAARVASRVRRAVMIVSDNGGLWRTPPAAIAALERCVTAGREAGFVRHMPARSVGVGGFCESSSEQCTADLEAELVLV